MKALRPELFVDSIKWFVSEEIGSHFVENLIINLEDSFVESEPHVPIIFVISPGDDP